MKKKYTKKDKEPLPLFASKEYRLMEKIGEGGFGQVYRAIHLNTKQQVAIKILKIPPKLDSNKKRRYIDRFERESLLVSRLQHPNIVRLLDKGQLESGLIYTVFEFIDGESLKDRLLKSGAQSPLATKEIMAQVLDGLSYAHEKGVIHRDIKPANIMLVTTQNKTYVKILDFGIGALINETYHPDYKSITLTQETLGTPSYCSPEQLRGEPPTPKSDLYVWGLLFIECITGSPAIYGSNLASVFHKQLNQENVPIPALIAGHPITGLLRRVLEKKSTERAGCASSIYKELIQLNFSAVAPIPASPLSEKDNWPSSSNECMTQTLLNDHDVTSKGVTERKQLSVLCVRVNVKSTAETFDHEIIEALHRDQKSQCCDIAIEYSAIHVGSLGDSLLFYFGYPLVSDSDARLCARTALDILSRIKKRNSLLNNTQGLVIEVCSGIHTGIMTCYSDIIPDGETANIAIELARSALPSQILCSEASKLILDTYISFEYSESRQIGIDSRETIVYLLTGERHVEAFGFLRANRHHDCFIGRKDELERLTSLLKQKRIKRVVRKRQNCRFFHVHGEAGIGKSRLVFELRDRAKNYKHIVIQCLPEHKHHALFPILNIIRHQYSLDAHSPATAVSQLRNALVTGGNTREQDAIALLCLWLNLPIPDNVPPIAISPDKQKERLHEALGTLLTRAENSSPEFITLYIFEDMHWADPASIEFIAYLLSNRRFQEEGHIFISTSRQRLPSILNTLDIDSIVLHKLNPDMVKEFIITMFDNEVLEERVISLITERTDGIPLFIEEFIAMLKQRQIVQRLNGIIDFSKPEKINELPNNLRDSLQQNLDELVYAKETAQMAATIGREFTYDLLVACSHRSEEQVQSDLNELLESELIYIQRKVDSDSYIYKHALIRDAAYESMPLLRRKDAHRQIAVALESGHVANMSHNPAVMAMHWSKAGDCEKAVEYGIKAANMALRRSSAGEAIKHGLEAQSWIDKIEEKKQLNNRLEIYGVLTSAYMETKGWGSKEVLFYSEESLKLLKSEKRHDALVSHLWWKVLNGIVGGRREDLANISAQMNTLLAHVNKINKSAIKCAEGFYHFTEGDRIACIEALSSSINYYDPKAEITHQQLYGFDVGVFAKATIARAYADTNQIEKAVKYAEDAVTEAKIHEHIPSIGISLMYYGLVHQQYQNRKLVKESSQELLDISEKHNLPIYKGFAQMLYGWATRDITQAEIVLSNLTTAGSLHGLGQFQSFYAELYAENGDYQEAARKIDECLALDQAINEPNYRAYLLFKRAQYLLCSGYYNRKAGLKDLDDAYALAKLQGVSYIMQKIKELRKNLKN